MKWKASDCSKVRHTKGRTASGLAFRITSPGLAVLDPRPSPLGLLAYTLLALSCSALEAVAGQEVDEVSLALELDGMATPAIQKLADEVLKEPDRYSTDIALRVTVHPKLDDPVRANRLYELLKDRLKPEQFEILSDHPLLQDPVSNLPLASLVLRLIGRTRSPDAKNVLLEALRSEHISYKAAAAHAIGLLGDKELLPVLQKEYDELKARQVLSQNKEYADGLVRGMLLLGNASYLPGLIKETATTASEVAGTALTIASGYTPPPEKDRAMKRFPYLRERYGQLQNDLVEIAPLYPQELAEYIVAQTDPAICDVLYRLLPRLITDKTYAAYIPALKAKCLDLRQLVLDVLTDGKVKPDDLTLIRKAVLEWYQGDDRVGRAWAVRNCGVLDPADRRRILLEVLESGNRWERVEAIKEIRREPDKDLLDAAQSLLAGTSDPDVQLHLARLAK